MRFVKMSSSVAFSAWVTMFILQFFLYGPALNIGFAYRFGFTVLVFLSFWLNKYLLYLSIEQSTDYKEDFENTFTPILALIYIIFWFVPVFKDFPIH